MLACEISRSRQAATELFIAAYFAALTVRTKPRTFMLCFSHGEGEVFSSSDVAANRGHTSTLSPGGALRSCRQPDSRLRSGDPRPRIPVSRGARQLEQNHLGPQRRQI